MIRTNIFCPHLQSIQNRWRFQSIVAGQEQRDLIWAAIDQLPERQREVMHLRAVEELTPNQIAEVLSIESGAVRSSLAAARKQLRSRLKDLRLESLTTDGMQSPCGSNERSLR